MAFDWSIKIEGASGANAQFVPQGGAPGSPLNVKVNDIVSWGNNTPETHQPWPTDSSYNLQPAPPNPNLSDPIFAQQSSSPAWVVVGTGTVYYRCKTHPNRSELGQIVIGT
jgi:plastocyanin